MDSFPHYWKVPFQGEHDCIKVTKIIRKHVRRAVKIMLTIFHKPYGRLFWLLKKEISIIVLSHNPSFIHKIEPLSRKIQREFIEELSQELRNKIVEFLSESGENELEMGRNDFDWVRFCIILPSDFRGVVFDEERSFIEEERSF